MPWDEPTEAIPAFLTVVMMPLAVSSTEGVAFSLVSYALLDLVVRLPLPIRGEPSAMASGVVSARWFTCLQSSSSPGTPSSGEGRECYNFLFDRRQITGQVRSVYSDEGADLQGCAH